MPSLDSSSFKRYTSQLIANATGAVNGPFVRVAKGEGVTFQVTGGALGAGEQAVIALYDPTNTETTIPHRQSAATIALDVDNTARTVYGPLVIRVEKGITASARGVAMVF
jgi:hypothetical protein